MTDKPHCWHGWWLWKKCCFCGNHQKERMEHISLKHGPFHSVGERPYTKDRTNEPCLARSSDGWLWREFYRPTGLLDEEITVLPPDVADEVFNRTAIPLGLKTPKEKKP